MSLFQKLLQEVSEHGYRKEQMRCGIAMGVRMPIQKFEQVLSLKAQVHNRYLSPIASVAVLMEDGFCFQRRWKSNGEQYWLYRKCDCEVLMETTKNLKED